VPQPSILSLGALEPASAYPHDLGGDDAAEALAGGGLFSLYGLAQEVAVSPLHHGEAAGGHARDQSQDRRLWRKYPRGLVAYLEEGKVPAGGEGLAYYLAKYVVSPPISLRRILSYDRAAGAVRVQRSQDQATQEEEVSALTFIGRMVQPILPKGSIVFVIMAACHVQSQEGEGVAHRVDGGTGSADQGTYRIVAQKTYP